jgi:hypothetical protein
MKFTQKHTLLTLCLVITTLLATNFSANAQKKEDEPEIPKAELKELKKRKKEMDPIFFKDIFEERNKLKNEFGGIERQIKNIGGILTVKDAEIEVLKARLDSLRSAAAANTTAKDPVYGTGTTANSGGNPSEDYTKGLVFKVQVGDINEAKLNGEVFQNTEGQYAVEKDDDGKLKYTLGYFRSYEEANDFKKNLRKINVKIAWIVAYKDGKKQNMKDAKQN